MRLVPGSKALLIFLAFLSIYALFVGRASAASGYESIKASIADFKERYTYDQDFKFWVNFIGWGLLIFAVSTSIAAAYLGVSPRVIWSFVGGFVLAEVMMALLGKAGLGFSIYGFFASFALGIYFAYTVYFKEHRHY